MGFLAWDLLILQPGSLSQTNLGPSASPLTARIALDRGYCCLVRTVAGVKAR